ncbi:MAG: homoserine kinase [Alphaproteobacteria bacterium]|nr:homoserine kinase [Alphaproteobacteria bacterium]
MTVWTQISLNEANAWLDEQYRLKATQISPIAEGVEDSVFKLDIGETKAVFLRLFERTEPLGPLSIAASLAKAGLQTCPPMKDINGNLFSELKGKPASLFPWVEGAWVERPSLDQVCAIGSFLGQMAKEGIRHCQNWKRENPRGLPWFEQTTAALLPVLPPVERRSLKDEMSMQGRFWKAVNQKEILHGPIHADMFRNNVMFQKDGRLAAVIDWGFCASDSPLIYDLAIVANDWCLKENTIELDGKRVQALMCGREGVLPLTAAEKVAWPMALRLGALRFYLSRQYDFSFPRDTNGKALDPAHFRDLLKAHRKEAPDKPIPGQRCANTAFGSQSPTF